MTVTLPNPDPTSPLSAPSHANLHASTNAALTSLGTRMGAVETKQTAAQADITQARRVSNTWVVEGDLVAGIILPVLWNLSPRAVEFEAAIVSVLTPPTGSSIEVDIQTGLVSDPTNTDAGSVLNSVLVVPEGENFSIPVGVSGFITPVQEENSYVQVVIRQVGSVEPGAGLTVQLNRLL
jgi:hypothetical protein